MSVSGYLRRIQADIRRHLRYYLYSYPKSNIYIREIDIVVYVPKKLHNKFEPSFFHYDGNYDTDKIKNF
uniref:Uncharacterized protein n=1 Tax=Meloidogyne incognita TaxID=6306 RepID=A0A914N704_MELIC